MDSEFSRKKALVFGVLLLVFLAIPVTIYTALQVQESRTRAEKATVLSLMPSSQTVKVNDQINLDVNINPGINQVDYVKMVINYDATRFDSPSTSFTIDPNSNFQYTADTISSSGQIIITLDVGSNPTDTIRSPEKIGTLTMVVGVQDETQEPELIAGETQVIFNEVLTEIRSIGSTDEYQENVLSNTGPATIIIEAEPTSTPTLSPTPIPSITSTPTPTLEPNVTPTLTPTPVCTPPDQVQNIKINCPNCGSGSPSPTQVPAG